MKDTGKIEGKWIYFRLLFDKDEKHKTQVWGIMAKDGTFELGGIKWFGRWRTYAFFPNSNTIYEDDCLIEIANFIKRLMDERKLQKL